MLALRRGANTFMIEGHAAVRAGDYEGAAAAFGRAVDAGGNTTVTALVNLAVAESRLGRDTDAIDHLSRARQLDPDNATVLYNLGILLVRAGRYADALGMLERVRVVEIDRCSDVLAALATLGRSPDSAIRERAAGLD